MEIEIIKKLIKSTLMKHQAFINKAKIAERYYENENDILYIEKPKDGENNPLRNADNRIPSNYYGLLVKQKAAYMFTYSPNFDIENEMANVLVKNILGDRFAKTCKKLCVDASNCTVAWLHVWKNDSKEFKYAVVDPKQIIPIYSSDLERKLKAVLRVYSETDFETGEDYTVYEYWTDEEVYKYRKEASKAVDDIENFNTFSITDLDTSSTELLNVLSHDLGDVPFIAFYNNEEQTSDLISTKRLIDVYDKIFSGYVNDVEDIQEVIFVLNGYGGTDLKQFLQGLKKYKTVDLQNDPSSGSDKSGLTTLTIDIPIEARNKLLEVAQEKIFTEGQGVNPNNQDFGNATGKALKYLYSLLELKSGLVETEFRLGFAQLIRFICRYLNVSVENITQTWTRCMIEIDAETAEIAAKSVGIISEKTLLKNHPWVENVEEEIEQKRAEEKEKQDEMLTGYGDIGQNPNSDLGGEDEDE